MPLPRGNTIEVHYFQDWKYDEALTWMKQARLGVLAGESWKLAVGSHLEEVVTFGAHTPASQMQNEALLKARGALMRHIERGGGATCHAPGQLVLYPIMSIRQPSVPVPQFTELLLNAAVLFLASFGIAARKDLDNPGVYVENFKLASVGFRSQKGVVTHGLALNYVNDLTIFETITPCGDPNQKMTSVSCYLKQNPGHEPLVPLPEAMKSLGSTFLRLYIEALTE